MLAPPWRVGAPSYGESWIRPWTGLLGNVEFVPLGPGVMVMMLHPVLLVQMDRPQQRKESTLSMSVKNVCYYISFTFDISVIFVPKHQ